MTVAAFRSQNSPFCCLVAFCTILFTLALILSNRCVQISRLRNPFLLDDLPHQSNYLYNDLSNNTIHTTLIRQNSPLTVHYMWCRKSHFEYKHYVSVMSVAKVLRPDQIVFHYLEMPLSDKKGYFTWFEDLQQEIAMLSLKPIHRLRYCGHDFPATVSKDSDFPNPNGVFMTDDVAVTGLSRELFHSILLDSCSQHHACDKQVAEKFQLFLVPESEPYSLAQEEGRAVLQCPIISVFNQANFTKCVQLNQRLFPADIWFRNAKFDVFVRKITYNSHVPLLPVKSTGESIPRVAHILRFDGDDTLEPLCYSSIKSVFVIGQMKHVFLHGHARATGPLWDKLIQEHAVTYVPVHVLDASSSVHKQLLYGLHILLQYGGMLAACDVIVQQPFEALLHVPAVSSVQKSQFHIIHHHMDFSVLFASPGSVFLKTFIPALKQMSEVSSARDIGAVGYHIYEQLPTTVYMETNLCSHHVCTGTQCKRSPAESSPKQAFITKLQFESSRPTSFQQLRSITIDALDIFQSLNIFQQVLAEE
ncbi:hypothetical protein BaRGS_00020233 [Batillaria attramentaria]|uniref:Glycosyltransferase n=1 Tax=Batillaria attramentaria TaxID=370345 RepID=A0ABD0KN26_9CAEN